MRLNGRHRSTPVSILSEETLGTKRCMTGQTLANKCDYLVLEIVLLTYILTYLLTYLLITYYVMVKWWNFRCSNHIRLCTN